MQDIVPVSHTATVVACTLNQFGMDFYGNYKRILESLRKAKENGARFRTGPELEITGYGCYDHFLEEDTYISAWRVVLKLLLDPITENMLCDFGMPVRYQSQNYNCRVIVLNKKILLIRPKKKLANSGHYTEQRWFTAWPDAHHTSITLPSMIQTSTGQTTTMFGDAVIECLDTSIGFDICEEMWQSCNTYSTEIIVNGSASYFETDKFSARCTLARAASLKNSGIYMYTNLVGGENRVYYDGGPMIFQNGELVAHGERFTLLDVDVLVAHLSLSKLKMKKRPHSTSLLRVPVDFRLSCNAPKGCTSPILLEQLTYFHECKELEWMMVITGWLWDYLVKTHSTGFLLPLSGGLDSCSVAILVHYLCRRLEQDQFIPEINEKLQRMYPHLHSYTTQSLCKEMLHTVYLATQYSSEETKSRASKLADHLFTSHRFIDIEQIIQEWSFIVDKSLGHEPSGLALENVQARSRMVASYLFAQMLSQEKSEKRNLLVLSSANLDETLFGYYTKYDCASADLNPIGSLTKSDLRCFLDFAIKHLPLPFLEEFLSAPPSAELSASQTDEVDMGLSYATLSRLAYARKDMGPSTLFHDSEESLGIPSTSTHQFLRKFTVNRHKAVILTPSCHLQSISTDVFFERKPFMYPTLDQMLWNPFLETLALDSPCQQKLNEEEIIDLIS